jgi:predicted nucleic acid-binding protein
MKTLVIDASVAIKWVVDEDGTEDALALRRRARLVGPDLLIAECANILWKKVKRRELWKDEALVAARLLQGAEIELLPTRSLLGAATRLAVELEHPAYDCLYLALAAENECQFVTADERLVSKIRQEARHELRNRAITLREAATGQVGKGPGRLS